MPTKASPALASSKQAGNSSRRDRAGTHVSIAALSLPPGVPGDVKGELVACLEALHWKYRSPPQQVQLRICWWGAPEGSDTVVAFHSSRGAGAAFPLTSGPRFLVRYLRDMGTLALVVEECPSGRAIGTVTLDTSQVDVSRPLQDCLQLLGANKQVLATADVSLRIKYSALLSSFEMAEHLASADKGLPLYPLTHLTNSRRTTAAQAPAPAAAAAAGSVVTGAVTGTPSTAPGVASRTSPSKTSLQQQQPHVGTAAPAASTSGAADSAAQGQEQQVPLTQLQLHQSAAGAPAPDAASAPAPTGMTGVTINPQLMQLLSQQQQVSAADPVLEVIRKAEQLKASLDQAAKAGVMLALPSPQQQQQQQQAAQQPLHSPLLQQQVVQQQQQQLLQLLQPAAGSSSLLAALTGANSSGILQQRLGGSVGGSAWLSSLLGGQAAPGGLMGAAAAADSTTTQHPLLLLGPPPAAGANVAAAAAGHSSSASLLTAGELLAALAGTPAGPSAAAGSQGEAGARAVKQPGAKGQPQPTTSSSRHKAHTRRKHTAAAAAAGELGIIISDDEQGGESATSSPHGSSGSHSSRGHSPSSNSSSSASLTLLSELDDLEELEDLLLQELLHLRQPPPAAAAAAKPRRHRRRSPGGHHKARARPHTQQQQQQGVQPDAAEEAPAAVAVTDGQGPGHDPGQPEPLQLQQGDAVPLPQLHVQLLSLRDLQAPPPGLDGVFAVLKCAGQQQVLDITALLHTQQHSMPQHAADQGQGGPGARHTCSTTLAVTAPLLQPPLAGQRHCLVVELWAAAAAAHQQLPADAPAAAAADLITGGKLLGIARVPLPCPLQQQQQPGAATEQYSSSSHLSPGGDDGTSSNSGPGGCLVVSGSYPVVDVLQGTAPAQLQLSIHLMPPADTDTAPEPTCKQSGNDFSIAADAVGINTEAPSAAVAAAAAGAEVVGVRHVIDVTLVSASGLPDAGDLGAGGQQVPESRFVKYCFPGDEPLYTQECGPHSAPVIAAHARHTVLLQPGETVAQCFDLDQPDTQEQQQLTFEVYDKWPQDPDSLAASGALPLQQVLDLCAPPSDMPSSSSSAPSPGPSSHVFLVQLALEPGCPEAAVQPAGRPVLLQVSVAYAWHTCYDVELAGDAGGDDGNGTGLEVHQQQQQGVQQQGGHTDEQPGELTAASDLPATETAVGQPSSYKDAFPLLQSAAADQPAGNSSISSSPADSPSKPGVSHRQEVSQAAAVGVAACTSRSVSVIHLGQTAEVCVRVIRACGLQAGVKEAEAWLGHGSGLLGRARQLGPHPYVTLSLLPGTSSLPVVRTPFQAQTFCPQFNSTAVLPLRLDAPTLSALGSAEALVEVWHHCPRSQAVAAALSRGLSSSYAMTGQQQVLLGSAHLPLQALLTHPQGVQAWVVLQSQRGVAAGAVRVEVSWSHVGGEPLDASPTGLPPLIRHPEWLALLPPAVSRRLSSYAALPPPGWRGQAVRLAVMLEELLLPGGDTQALERPRISHYCTAFRLPGSECEVWGPSQACSSSASGPHLLARTWAVHWAHTHTAWATGDAALARALLSYPLTLTVHKREPGKGAGNQQQQQQQQGLVVQGHSPQSGSAGGGAGSGGDRGAGPSAGGVLVPVGGIEVDLSPLLATRPGSAAPSCRWVSGCYPLVHPVSKAFTNTRLRLKVLLDLEPAGQPPTQHWLDTHPAHAWRVAGPLALTPSSSSTAPHQHRGLTAAAAAGVGQAGSGDTPTAPAAAAGVGVTQEAAAADSTAADTPVGAGSADVGAAARAGDAGGDSQQEEQQQQQQQDMSKQSGPATEPLAGSSASGLSGELQQQERQQQQAGDVSAAVPRVAAVTRLRASVSRVAAPPPQGLTSPHASAAAAGIDSGEYLGPSATPLPVPPEQQQLALLLVATGSHLDPQQQQQPDNHQLELYHQQDSAMVQAMSPAVAVAAAGGMRVCDVRLCVESALNLDLPQLAEGWSPGLYVRCTWPFTGSLLATPLVQAVGGPLGGCSSSATWLYATHLPLMLLQQQQQQQQHMDEAASSAQGDPIGCSAVPVTVLLQVWCRAVPPADADGQLSHGLSAAPSGRDLLLGVASLDLSSLTLLGCVDGWYNILDTQQQTRGQIKVSLTPLRPLAGGTPALPPHTQQHLAQQLSTADPAAAAAAQQGWLLGQPPRPSAAVLDSGSSSLPAWPWLTGGGVGVGGLSGHTGPPATVAALESSLAELQQHLKHLQDTDWQQQQQEGEELPLPGDVSDLLLLQDPPLSGVLAATSSAALLGGGEATGSTEGCTEGFTAPLGGYTNSGAAVDELSDAAFMALASQSTAAAEAVAEAAAATVQQQAGQPDRLLDTLRAHLEELDKLSAALAVRISGNQDSESSEGAPGQGPGPVTSMTPAAGQPDTGASTASTSAATAAAVSGVQQQQQQQRFASIRTLSDDEEFLVAPGAALSDSEPDTDELMGHVDWSLAQNSDDEADAAAGPPQQQQQSSSIPLAHPSGVALVQPLNTQDWMFDIGRSRPSAPTAAAAAAGPAAGGDPTSSSVKVPVHPGILSPAAAQVQAEASAARLAQVEAAAAAEASRAAAAAERAAAAAAVTGAISCPPGAAAGTAAAAAARGPDMWEQLGQVEEEDEAAAVSRQQRNRQQQQQQVVAVLAQSQRQPHHQQQQPHDPRRLPDALESRLDALLAEYQVAASGPGALVGRGPVGPLQQFGGPTQQAQAAAAFGRLEGGPGGAWASDDYKGAGRDSSEDRVGEGVPITRVTHVSREQAAEGAGAGGGGGVVQSRRAAARSADADADEVLPAVSFANALPPVQDDFVLTYSDGPPASWRQHTGRQHSAAAGTHPQQQQQAIAHDIRRHSSSSAGPGAPHPSAAGVDSSSSSSRHRLPGSITSAPVTTLQTPSSAPQVHASTSHQPSTAAVTAAGPQAQAASSSGAVEPVVSYGGGVSSGYVLRTVGRSGPPPGPVDILDEMFSFSRQPSGSARSSSSSIPGGAGSIRHPGM